MAVCEIDLDETLKSLEKELVDVLRFSGHIYFLSLFDDRGNLVVSTSTNSHRLMDLVQKLVQEHDTIRYVEIEDSSHKVYALRVEGNFVVCALTSNEARSGLVKLLLHRLSLRIKPILTELKDVIAQQEVTQYSEVLRDLLRFREFLRGVGDGSP